MDNVTVVGVNLSDLGADGEQNPLSAAIMNLCTTAAGAAASTPDYVAARTAVAAMIVPMTNSGLTHAAEFFQASFEFLEQAIEVLGRDR